MKGPGRNTCCPCGSGKKYKECCLNAQRARVPSALDVQALQVLNEWAAFEIKRQRAFGQGALPNSTTHCEHRWVNTAGKIHRIPIEWSLWEFIVQYVWDILDVSWGNDELAKPVETRHPLLKWFASAFPSIKSLPADTYAIESVRSREANLYLAFAYDLWTADHNARVELKEIFRRLKITDQFHGAVYELRVIAAFFRAGFLIRFENETDSTTSHHEFHALHVETRSKYSVECKARGVSGMLGKAGLVPELSTIRPKIGRHIRKALNKRAEHTRIVFIDVNLPITAGSPMDWMEDIKTEIAWMLDRERGDEPYPPAFLIFTNHPAHYDGPDDLLYESGVAMKAFKMPEFYPDAASGIRLHPAVGELLFYLKRYENVPNQWFDRSSIGEMSIVDGSKH